MADLDEGKTRDIDLSVELDAPPEAVWRAVSEGAELTKWFAPEARVTPGEGGKIFVSWGEGMAGENTIATWDPPRRLRHPSGQNAETKAPLWVDWSIEGREGARTTLRLVHSGFSAGADWDEEFDSHVRGWKIFLANLAHYLARHAGRPCAQHAFTAMSERGRDAVWRALLSARCLDRDGTLAAAKSGDAYRLTTSRGDVLSGKVQILGQARDLALTVSELDDALVRVSLERTGAPGAHGTFVYGVVLVYGDAAARGNELAASLGEIAADACRA